MFRVPLIAFLFAATAATAQPVEVTSLAAPDAFSTPGRDTGLPGDLWRGTAIEVARLALPALTARPLPPAYAEVARRVLATGARGPTGAEDDPGLAGARINVLIALGDMPAAARILRRSPSLDRAPELARAAAEAALLAGDEARACTVAEGLTVGRDEVYWLRLRAYCQAVAGQPDLARLTLDLAQEQARDPVYGRLMAARLHGAAPGAPSLRNGLDYALSRSLGLDLATAKPAAAVAAALSGASPEPPDFDLAAIDIATGGLAAQIAAGPPAAAGVSALIAAAAEAAPAGRAKLQAAAVMAAALLPEITPDDRVKLAGFTLAEGRAPFARNLLLEAAVHRKAKAEVALVGLLIAADAGAAGPAPADRARFARALTAVGLTAEARLVVLEGLAGLK